MKRCKSTFFRFFLHMSFFCCNFAPEMDERTNHIAEALRAGFEVSEAKELARWIVEEMPENADSIEVSRAVDRLLQGEPVQYVFEHALWMGLDLRVTPATLIPRPETAELVEIVSRVQSPESRVLDIGTGSGCIAIAFKQRHPDWMVSACDVSEEALVVALENARRNNVEVRFFHCDILREVPEDCPFDLIVSNPPYVLESEKISMESMVLDYEPASALFVPDHNPLLFYRRITELAADGLLISGGQLLFETNERFGTETAELLREKGFTDVEILQDMFGKQRFVKGVCP